MQQADDSTTLEDQVERVLTELKDDPERYLTVRDLNELTFCDELIHSWVIVVPHKEILELTQRLDQEGVRFFYFAGYNLFDDSVPGAECNLMDPMDHGNKKIDVNRVKEPLLKKLLTGLALAASRMRFEYLAPLSFRNAE